MNQNNHSPHWIDKLAAGILKWQEKNDLKKLHVDDMKTPSGRVHTGALKGVLLHDMVAKALSEKSEKVVSTYVFNSMDPMDGLPSYLDKNEYEKYMGKPMHLIPAPSLENCGIDLSKANKEELEDFKNAQSFGHFYAYDFIHAFRKLGCSQKIIWSSDLYESGKMDDAIREALNNVEKFRKIYKEVAEYDLPKNWYPFQVICPDCDKMGTTLVTSWDGEQVEFECKENQVEWAKGCGHSGKISPFGGNGKLLWKVDWPAHWKTLGINIEGAGKDHTSAGGSRDMANAMCKEIFEIQKPFDIPYEWILIRGAKMSSSKGVGTSAREFTELFPAEIGRFLFANKHYNSVIDFDPTTMSIPDLFDEYDQAAKIYWGSEKGDLRLGRAFEISQTKDLPESHFLPRFRDIALWMQDPAANLSSKFENLKGSKLTKQELELLNITKTYAQKWVDLYAPTEFQLTAKKELPKQAKNLSGEQKKFLTDLIDLINSKKTWSPQELQQEIFDLAKASLGAKQGFQAIYLAFLGKTSGPKAAWFLLSIDKELREKRIREISNL
ncbi:MAG: lysine--tRNA ligase [Patescibacteria group bacterium]